MKFLILFLTTTAFATSSSSRFIHLDDGSIIIDAENGRRVIISNEIGPHGQHVMEIEINGPDNFSKKIQINNEMKDSQQDVPHLITQNYRMSPRNVDEVDLQRTKRSKSSSIGQKDVLAEIMREYQGVTDVASFQILLNKVRKAVQEGKIDSAILDYLQFLTQEQPWSHPNGSGFELSEPQENQQWNLQQNTRQGYPYWQKGMLWDKQWPLMQWYEQKWMPERYMWQNKNGVNGIDYWNQKLPTYYDSWIPMKDTAHQELPWTQQSMNHYLNQEYPLVWNSQVSNRKNGKDSSGWSHNLSKWMGTKNWISNENWKDAKN